MPNRLSVRGRHVVAGLTASVAWLVLAAGAQAATTRFAGPNGSGTGCTSASPCTLQQAVTLSTDGDEVIALPGDYGSAQAPLSTPIELDVGVYVHGEDGQPMPRVFSNAPNAFAVFNAQAVLSRIDVEHSGSGVDAAVLVDPGAARELIVHTSAGHSAFGAAACGVYPDGGPALLSDSVCRSSGDGVPAILEVISGLGFVLTPQLRNVTAVASGAGSAAIEAQSGFGATLTVQATNVIARGTVDVRATSVGNPPGAVGVALDHSSYATVDPHGATASITPPGTNGGQTTPPRFVNAPAGDFHQAAGSPTIDAGVTNAANGPFDFDGDPRTLGSATDIGADEFVPLPPSSPTPPGPPPPGPPPSGGPPPTGGPLPQDHTPPVLRSFRLSNSVFAAASHGARTDRRGRRVAIGTTVSYSLTEPATVAFSVQRAARGRASAGKCARPTRSNRKKRACLRWVKVRGAFKRAGVAGANRFRFVGRLGNHKLAPGRYRLVAVPSDVPGNVGRAASRKFRIVAPR